MLFSSSPPPPLLRVNSLYTAKPPFTDSMVADAPRWAQKTITLLPHRRGCHLITPKCIKQAPLSLSMRITTLMFETTLRLSSTKLFPREDLPLEAYPRSAGGSTASPSQRGQVKSGWKIWEQQKFSFSVSTSSFSG
ncbi:uncharacterized protein LOC18099719 isoform X2 [Populus trichocarpa]|uniref:uncharacterized protein LOC18099719 isoform X2 n=1 Tax=Populus trichocarpa TaxID=3694 RepID=UPI000D188113|nr:uncharacterized protein LOC18099719 isoform X2 [Populus trichocarpa]|eukprot:XP_024456402.1 uncharacterized protein LOC18099719 isoform X2 [Populus trichocarpa]